MLLSIVQREAKMAWSFLGEGFDLSGDAAVFVAIQADAQDPVLRANVAAIVVPAWVSFSLSVVVSVVSLVVRASIFIVQLRRRRQDISHIGGRISYLQQLEAKIEDGQRTIRMVRSPSPRICPRSNKAGARCTLKLDICRLFADLLGVGARFVRGRAYGGHRHSLLRAEICYPDVPGHSTLYHAAIIPPEPRAVPSLGAAALTFPR